MYRVVRALPTSRPPPRSGASAGPQVPHPTSCPSPGRLRFRLTFSLTASSPAPMLGHPTITVLLPVIAQPHGGCLAPHFRSGRLRAQRWSLTWAFRVAPSCAAGTSADDPGTVVAHKQSSQHVHPRRRARNTARFLCCVKPAAEGCNVRALDSSSFSPCD